MKVVKTEKHFINLDSIAHVWVGDRNIQVVYANGATLGLQLDVAQPLLNALERYVIVA